MLSQKIADDEDVAFGTLPVTVYRNAYGRQLGSFSALGNIGGISDFPMRFRACSESFSARLFGKFCRLLRQKSLQYDSIPADFFLVNNKIMHENPHIKRF